VETVRPAAAGHQAAGELVDDGHLAILDDVLLITLKEGVGAQRLVDGMQNLDVGGVVQIVDGEQTLGARHALIGERGGLRLLVDQVISRRLLVAVLVLDLLTLGEPRDDDVDLVVEIDRNLRRTGDNERRPRLVNQDRVHLVDDRVDVLPLHHPFEIELHVVAQVVEAELVVGAVGDVGSVRFLALGIVHLVLDATNGEPEELIDPAHPIGIATREVVVDCDHMAAASRQSVERDRQGRRQGLALPGAHLRDPSFVEDQAAHELNVEMTHTQRPLARLTDQCKDLLELWIEEALDEHAAFARILWKIVRRRLHPIPDGYETAA